MLDNIASNNPGYFATLILAMLGLAGFSAFADERAERPRRIVAICDLSGSVLDHVAALDDAIEKILATVRKDDLFNLFFAQDTNSVSLFIAPAVLTPDRTKQLDAFWDKRAPHGDDAMVEAVGWAVGQMPDELWIISDGRMDNPNGIRRILQGALEVRSFHVNYQGIGPHRATPKFLQGFINHQKPSTQPATTQSAKP